MKSSSKNDFNEQFLVKYINTLFNGELAFNFSFDEKIFEENSLKQAFKTYLRSFLEDIENKGLCNSCIKILQTQETRFFNFKTENYIKKLKESGGEIKFFRENFFKMIEKFVAADLKITDSTNDNRLSLMHLEILKNNIEESNKKIIELKENILFLILHPVEKNHFFELDESFPYNEYKSKLKENLFMDAKFSFDFERILSQITDLKAALLKNNSPAKTNQNNNNNNNSNSKNNIPIVLNSNKKEKEDNINRTEKKLSKNDENQKKTRIKIKDPNKQINSPSEIKKYLTPPKERPAPNHIFIDDTFVGHKEENEIETENFIKNGRKESIGHKINTKSQSAKNSDHKVILFMAGNEKWTKLNEQSNKKVSKKTNEDTKTLPVNNINSNSAKKKKPNNTNKIKDKTGKNDEKNKEKTNENYAEKINNKNNEKINEKYIINSEIFQEKFSEIQCVGDQSECLTPLKLLKELAQFKNLALEKSLTSEFNKSKDSENILKKTEDEKNFVKVSKKLKDKFKQDYNLDIDLIEKESKNSAMQTPSFGANNGLQPGKHPRNGAEKNLPSKKMEQINEVSSPKDEKYGHYKYIEKIYQPVLKKNPKK